MDGIYKTKRNDERTRPEVKIHQNYIRNYIHEWMIIIVIRKWFPSECRWKTNKMTLMKLVRNAKTAQRQHIGNKTKRNTSHWSENGSISQNEKREKKNMYVKREIIIIIMLKKTNTVPGPFESTMNTCKGWETHSRNKFMK